MKKIFLALFAVFPLFLNSCSKSEVTVTSIIFNSEGEWFREAISGMEDAAKKYKINFQNIVSYYDLDSEYGIAMKAAKDGANAIVFTPIDSEKSSPIATELRNSGIPVVTWNTVVNSQVDSKIIVDSTALGSGTGDYLVRYFAENNLPKQKTLLLSNYVYTISEERCRGFKDSIKPLLDSEKIEVVQEIQCELTEETKRHVKHVLQTTPDIGLIWCWNQTSLLACLETLKELGRTDILLCGTDLSSLLARELMDSTSNLICVTTQQPYLMGYTAVENALIAICGNPVEETVVIPVTTYTKEDKVQLQKYLASFKINK